MNDQTDLSNFRIITNEEYESLKECQKAISEGMNLAFIVHGGHHIGIMTSDEVLLGMTKDFVSATNRANELEKELKKIKALPWYKKIFIK